MCFNAVWFSVLKLPHSSPQISHLALCVQVAVLKVCSLFTVTVISVVLFAASVIIIFCLPSAGNIVNLPSVSVAGWLFIVTVTLFLSLTVTVWALQ